MKLVQHRLLSRSTWRVYFGWRWEIWKQILNRYHNLPKNFFKYSFFFSYFWTIFEKFLIGIVTFDWNSFLNKFSLQLSCFLSQEVKYVQLGIKGKLTEEIEKHSELIGRNARYEKKALVERLPAYLSIQMVRFFYKEKDKIGVICRKFVCTILFF